MVDVQSYKEQRASLQKYINYLNDSYGKQIEMLQERVRLDIALLKSQGMPTEDVEAFMRTYLPLLKMKFDELYQDVRRSNIPYLEKMVGTLTDLIENSQNL